MVMYALLLATGIQVSGCPATIQDTQVVAVSTGWDVRIEKRPRLLERVTVYSGEPSRRRSLQPVPGKNGSSIWGFAGENIWIECRYSDSAAVLIKNLGVVKSCSFEPAEGGTSNPARVTCEKKK
ncbi:STY0301 family protein [Pseudoxanthomonas sacheonensis]|uniref:STY0301 family protein n=1 Tax=Pseudoxanthomonas sacheonensis TaxID=443615 RepID=UPI003D2F72C0